MCADDSLLQLHFEDPVVLQDGLQLCDLLLDQLVELGFKVNPGKSALLMQLNGGSSQQTRERLNQDYEIKSLRHRLAASKATMKEVANAVHNSRSVTEGRRKSIWGITAWASALYGLHVG